MTDLKDYKTVLGVGLTEKTGHQTYLWIAYEKGDRGYNNTKVFIDRYSTEPNPFELFQGDFIICLDTLIMELSDLLTDKLKITDAWVGEGITDRVIYTKIVEKAVGVYAWAYWKDLFLPVKGHKRTPLVLDKRIEIVEAGAMGFGEHGKELKDILQRFREKQNASG